MRKREQASFELRLTELRKLLLREVNSAEKARREEVVKPGDTSSVPTHPADDDVEGLESEIAIAQNEELLLEQVEAALERIRAGRYGVCSSGGAQLTRSACRPFLMRPVASIALAANVTRSRNRCAANRDGLDEFARCRSPIAGNRRSSY